MTEQQMHKPRWLEMTINVQSLLAGAAGAALALVIAYYTLVGRVALLEDHDRAQETHFGRIEAAMQEQRSDTRDQLKSISQDVKELSNKFDQLKDQMISNSAGNRPEMRKWSK